MKTARTQAQLSEALEPARRSGRTIGLVPTMGYLHDGHLALLRAARERCEVVVMSLFVNPTQFGPDEDLEAYPRDDAHDARLAEEAGVDVLYAPSAEEVYPAGFSTWVEVGDELTGVLEGAPEQRGAGAFPRGPHRGGQAAQLGRRRTSSSSARRTLSRRS